MMKKLVWMMKQLLPLSYATQYRTENNLQHVCLWKMWLGGCYQVRHYEVV